MIDGYSLTRGSLRFIDVPDWYLREVRPLGKIEEFPDSKGAQSNPRIDSYLSGNDQRKKFCPMHWGWRYSKW
jgi:hypothetical protein